MPNKPPEVTELLANVDASNTELVTRWADALANVPGVYQRVGAGPRMAMARANIELLKVALIQGAVPLDTARKFVDAPIYHNQPIAEFVEAMFYVDQMLREYLAEKAEPAVAWAAWAYIQPILAGGLSQVVQMREARHSTAGMIAEMGQLLREGGDVRTATGRALGRAAHLLEADLFVVNQITPHDVRLFATSQSVTAYGIDPDYVWPREAFPRLDELERGVAVNRQLEPDRPGPEGLLHAAGFRFAVARPLQSMGTLVGFCALLYRDPPATDRLPIHELACIEPLLAAHVAFAYNATALSEADAAIRALFEASPSMLLALDRRGRVVRANPQFMDRIGMRDGLIGMPLSWLVHPSWLDRFQSLWQQMASHTTIDQARLDLLTTHSERLPVVITGRWLESPGELCLLAIMDVTKQVERQASDEKRIDDLTAFAHQIAHDLRHPFRTIAGFAGMLQEDLTKDPARTAGHVERIVDAALEGNAMITGLLAYARTPREQAQSTEVTLADLVEGARNHFREPLETGRIAVELGRTEQASFLGNQAALRALLNNLIENAMLHGDRPQITVTLSAHPSDPGWGELWVRDDGVGIPAEDQGDIFDVFVRGESRQPGSGVGLAIVRRIAEGHGGHVTLESGAGQGCLFRVRLPTP